MTHFFTGIQPPARRHSIQPICSRNITWALSAICRLLPYPTHASTAVVCNLCMTILFTWPTPTDEFGLIDWLTTEDAFSPRDRMWLAIAACLWSHMPVSLSLSDLSNSCAAVHCMMPSFCICTPGKEVGLTMQPYVPKKEMRYTKLTV